MDPIWIVTLVAGSCVVALLMTLPALLRSGKTLARAGVSDGRVALDVPSGTKRVLWIRYRLTLVVPPARGQRTHPGSCYGIALNLDAGGQRIDVARGGLAPAHLAHFGVVDYMHTFSGGPGQQVLATTVKVCELPGSAPLRISGSVTTARENRLLEAEVWVAGRRADPATQR